MCVSRGRRVSVRLWPPYQPVSTHESGGSVCAGVVMQAGAVVAEGLTAFTAVTRKQYCVLGESEVARSSVLPAPAVKVVTWPVVNELFGARSTRKDVSGLWRPA